MSFNSWSISFFLCYNLWPDLYSIVMLLYSYTAYLYIYSVLISVSWLFFFLPFDSSHSRDSFNNVSFSIIFPILFYFHKLFSYSYLSLYIILLSINISPNHYSISLYFQFILISFLLSSQNYSFPISLSSTLFIIISISL